MPIPKSKANLKDPKINQAQIAAGQRKIDFLKKWNSNRIDPLALSLLESTKVNINEQQPGCLAVTVEGVKRIPKGIEPLVFATDRRIRDATEQLRTVNGFKGGVNNEKNFINQNFTDMLKEFGMATDSADSNG